MFLITREVLVLKGKGHETLVGLCLKPTGGRSEVRNEARVDTHMTLRTPFWSFLSLEGLKKVSLIEMGLFFLTDSPFIMSRECS